MKPMTFFGWVAAVALAAIATLASSAWCAGPDWAPLDENADSRFYYDQSGMSKAKEGVVRVRTRVVYTEEGKATALKILEDKKFQKLFETHYLHDLNCQEGESRLLEAAHLDEAGVTLQSTDLAASTEWEAIPPYSRMALVAEKVCGKGN